MNIVLTGSSTGIGRHLTLHLLGQNHQVWGVARSDQSDFAFAHPQFRFCRADVADYSTMEGVATEIARHWSGVDAVIACAGLQGEIGRTLASDPTRWGGTIRANLDGTYHTIRAFAGLVARTPRRAKIVCFSGGGSTKARPNFSAYGAAKTAIVRLIETIAEEERDRPLDINAIAPGAINTRLTDEVLALGPAVVGAAEHAAATKQKETGGASIDRVCALIDWLLSPASDGISGRLLSAPWDPWTTLAQHQPKLAASDIYTLRRIGPEERGEKW